ncbi:helix-turn-helix transcriptional regulator [Algibacter miyuki]|uniref:Helix-turn-helix transcriptional regulator n=1 Tax=Algibacter miyuki TaxID=1306933 RepID=A0ABV5H5D2_9FLAO|nr:hypothetical protein [Algibacter miyuki]MDN3665589.1 hypothetical protein [Algibacter miyuki]
MALTNNQPTLYPGMMASASEVEFFVVEDEINYISEGKINSIANAPFGIIQLTKEEIAKDPEADAALKEWHPNSEFKRQVQFLKCRFGGLDYTADMKGNQFGEPDYWDCPKRATCPFNGVICKLPKYQDSQLTSIDIELMKLLSTTYTNEVIADKLNLAFGSFHKLKQALYSKLGDIQTKQELALIAKSLNLI